MKIGLSDVDGHAKKKKWGATIYPNLALCKIARYHKQQGDPIGTLGMRVQEIELLGKPSEKMDDAPF